MVTSLASLLTGRAAPPDVAMTGEITLRGLVLPIGGLKEKVLAAHRAGIKKVLLPFRNKRDIDEIPEEIRKDIELVLIKKVGEILEHVLLPPVLNPNYSIPPPPADDDALDASVET